MTPYDYKYQNPSSFACLMLIRAIVIFTPLGIQNLNMKRKTNWIVVVVVKWRHRENCLLKAEWKGQWDKIVAILETIKKKLTR